MSARVITVGTNAGGIPDFLTDRKTGFIVEKEDPQNIAEVVTMIRSMSEEEKDRIRATAEALVYTSYTWDTVTTAMKELFAELARRS